MNQQGLAPEVVAVIVAAIEARRGSVDPPAVIRSIRPVTGASPWVLAGRMHAVLGAKGIHRSGKVPVG